MTKLDYATQIEEEAQETMKTWDIEMLVQLAQDAEENQVSSKYTLLGGF